MYIRINGIGGDDSWTLYPKPSWHGNKESRTDFSSHFVIERNGGFRCTTHADLHHDNRGFPGLKGTSAWNSRPTNSGPSNLLSGRWETAHSHASSSHLLLVREAGSPL